MINKVLLCTLLPFGGERLEDGLLESPFSINTRMSYMKFSVMLSGHMTSFLCPLRGHYEFLKLYGFQKYIRIVGLLKVEGESVRPKGLRLFLDKEALRLAAAANLCGLEFMDFESALSETLKTTAFVVEKRKQRIDSGKIEVSDSCEIFEGLYWSFKLMEFATQVEALKTLEMRPTSLVFDATNHWQEILLSQVHSTLRRSKPLVVFEGLLSSNATLIITHDQESWASTCENLEIPVHKITENGISSNLLTSSANAQPILICSPQMLQQNFAASIHIRETIKNLMAHVTESPRSDSQIRRFIVDNMCKKMPEFVVPLEYIQVATVLIDDIEKLTDSLNQIPPKLGLRFHQIVRDSVNTKPQGLSRSQMQLCIPNLDLNILGAVSYLIDAATHIIPAPKSLLKKFKIFPHLVKKSAVEERLDKIFSQRRSPLPVEETIKRFSGKTCTLEDAKELALKHFDRLSVSLGAYVTVGEVDTISAAYGLRAYTLDRPQCMVCFEGVGHKYSISICGHIYCKDCCKMHFNSEWLLLRSKECPACRVPLLLGDVFFIDQDAKPAASISSKQLAIDNFFKSMRTLSNVSTWPNVEDKYTKHIVITDISNCRPIDLLKTYADRANSFSVHIFCDQEQNTELLKFANSF